MAKLNLRTPAVIIGVSFLLIWYGVMHQRINSREHLTDVKPIVMEDRRGIMDYITTRVISEENANKLKLNPEQKKFIAFLDANPITAIDDKTTTDLIEIIKKNAGTDMMVQKFLENPTTVKEGVRAVGKIAIALCIFMYADHYEKLKEPPTQAEFKTQVAALVKNDHGSMNALNFFKENINSEERYKYQLQDLQNRLQQLNEGTEYPKVAPQNRGPRKLQLERDIDMTKKAIDGVTVQKRLLGDNTYPMGGSASPLVNQLFDIVYKYYFGETISGAGLASGAWKAIIGVFGSLGAIAVVGLIVYFVFLR